MANVIINQVNAQLNSRLGTARDCAAVVGNACALDCLVSKWGYDQTNVSYYAVVKRTAKSVRLVELERWHVPLDPKDPQAGGFAVPTEVTIGEPFTRRVSDDGSVRITDCSWARPWDRTPQEYTCGG